MADSTQKGEKRPGGPADHLANERTFLAWIRTAIALMGFGFVIVKFALFIKQMSLAFDKSVVPPDNSNSATIGVLMVALGAIVSVLAYFRYRTVERQLNNSVYFPSSLLSGAILVCIILGAVLLIIYLLPNIKI